MGYGLIQPPLIIIADMDLNEVVPSILISLALVGLVAAIFHPRNVGIVHEGSERDLLLAEAEWVLVTGPPLENPRP